MQAFLHRKYKVFYYRNLCFKPRNWGGKSDWICQIQSARQWKGQISWAGWQHVPRCQLRMGMAMNSAVCLRVHVPTRQHLGSPAPFTWRRRENPASLRGNCSTLAGRLLVKRVAPRQAQPGRSPSTAPALPAARPPLLGLGTYFSCWGRWGSGSQREP